MTEESFKKPAEKGRQENVAMWKKELAGRVDPGPDSERMFMSTQTNAPRFEGLIQKLKYSEDFLLEFSDITHSHSNSYGFKARNFVPSLTEAESRKKKAYELNRVLCTWFFFSAFLKGDAYSREFLRKPAPDKELLAVAYKPLLPLHPTQEEFFTLLRDKGRCCCQR